jgi:sulfur carrier protein ThiS
MMHITLKCFGIYRKYLPEGTQGNRASLTVADDMCVNDLLNQLGVSETHFAVFIDGQLNEDRQNPLQAGAEIMLLQPTSGG